MQGGKGLLLLIFFWYNRNQIDRVSEQEWDVIIIIHSVKMGKINNHVKKYLDQAEELDKVILLTTTASGDPGTAGHDVDAVTCASKGEEIDSLTADIVNRVNQVLHTGG